MKKNIDMLDLKIRFNDAMMRELGLDITENDYVYDMDTESILQIKGKFIKYCDYEYPILKYNEEIELNLIENPRLAETIILPFITNFCNRKGLTFQSVSQYPIDGTNKGYFILSYIYNDEVKEIRSDNYINESVRIFNLICKLNKTEHLYRFNEFDIEIPKKSNS